MKVVILPKAEKDLRVLPKSEQKRVTRKLILLSDCPYAGKSLRGQLKNFYSLRAWPYRIIYEFIDTQTIGVVHILHRKDAYKVN